jgi:sirohydrochlorin ferrochelatase
MPIDSHSPTEEMSPRTAVLLIAHGSRRAEANDDLVKLAGLILSRNQYDLIEVSYLELATPTILEGGRKCVDRSARRILMLPYFLSAGVHVITDLEEARRQLAHEFPQVDFVLCPHLGLHPLMAEIVMARLNEGASSNSDET